MTKRKGTIGPNAGVILCIVLVPVFWGMKKSKQPPLVALVDVVPVVIEPLAFAGADPRNDNERFLRHLSDEATKRSERTLIECRIAGKTERSPLDGAPKGDLVLTGTVRLPISLPPHLRGVAAAYHRGEFVTTRVILSRLDETILSSSEVTLRWGDVWWYTGGKQRFDRPLDRVIDDFVRKSIALAVRRLTRDERVRETGD